MAQAVKVGGFIYRINPADDRQLQRATMGSNSWSRVTEFNGHHILDLLLAPTEKTSRSTPTMGSISGSIVGA